MSSHVLTKPMNRTRRKTPASDCRSSIVKREKPATDPDMSHSRTMSARLRVRRL